MLRLASPSRPRLNLNSLEPRAVPAAITGKVFLDQNANGRLDTGEPPVTGALVYIDTNANGKFDDGPFGDRAALSDVNGVYEFTGLTKANAYAVGYSAPGHFSGTAYRQTSSPALTTVDVVGDKTFNGPTVGLKPIGGTVTGFVFVDQVENQTFDDGTEMKPAGVAVFHDANGNGILDPGREAVAISQPDGSFTLAVREDGDYTFRVARAASVFAPTGSVQVTPLLDPVRVAGGAAVDVGGVGVIVPTATGGIVRGRVFADANGDGLFNAGRDVGVAGATVYADLNGNGSYDLSFEPGGKTSASGQYTLTVPGDGTVTIRAAVAEGQIAAPPGRPLTVNGGTEVAGQNFTVTDISPRIDSPVGGLAGGTVGGKLSVDVNSDGVIDTNDTVFAGVIIYADIDGNAAFDAGTDVSTPTRADGTFALKVSEDGTYDIRVVAPADFVLAFDSDRTVTLTGGAAVAEALPFVIQPAPFGGVITGSVYRDADGNGAFSVNEAVALANVYIDANNDGEYQTGEAKALTDFDGRYTLVSRADGNQLIRVSWLGGSDPGREIVVAGGSTVSGLNLPSIGRTAADRAADPRANRVGFAAAAGPGRSPSVVVYNADQSERFTLEPYDPAFPGGVRVAVGDVTGDGVSDVVTAPGPGGGPHVKIFDGTGGALVAQFFAFDPGFGGGAFVACGDTDNDGRMEIVVGAGAGGGPNVRVFDGDGVLQSDFFAYGLEFPGGVDVAASDTDGDGLAEIVTGAGAGGGPHVRVFGNDGRLRREWFAYDTRFTGGVRVAGGDVNGDGFGDVVAAPGFGGGPHVRAFDGRDGGELFGFLAGSAGASGGADVAVMTGDGRAELIVGSGRLGSEVQVIDAANRAVIGRRSLFGNFLGGLDVG